MRRVATLCVLLVCIGCGVSVHVTRLSSAPEAMLPIEVTQVELYVDSKPPHEYIAVARLDAAGSKATNFELVDALRERAAELGCDGVIVEPGPSRSSVGGTCILWRR
jgi:hypothetical protein